ncbi:MAG: ComEA family DNA-binding protein [Chloroflexota bacterium]
MQGADRTYLAFIFFLILSIGAGLYCLEQRQPFGADTQLELSSPVDITSADSADVIATDDLPNPGVYTFPVDTTLGEIIDTVAPHSDLAVELVLGATDSSATGPQRIDLNRAEPWLLEALPGIGEKRAAAIVCYREEHGGFTAPEELLFVEGIGPVTYEAVEGLVTVTPFASDVASCP